MRSLLFLLCLSSIAPLAAQSSTPIEEMAADTPSLEAAYPGEIFIERTEEANGVIAYSVQIFAPQALDSKQLSSNLDVAIVVRDKTGNCLFRGLIDEARVDGGPAGNDHRFFAFSIHKSVEPTTLINIGHPTGFRMSFRAFRLPQKTIDHPKAKP